MRNRDVGSGESRAGASIAMVNHTVCITFLSRSSWWIKLVITTDVDRVLFTTVPAEIAACRADRIVCDFVTAWIIHTRYIHEKRNIRGLSQSIYDTRINLFGRRRSAFYFLPFESCETFPSCGSLINSTLAVVEESFAAWNMKYKASFIIKLVFIE